MAGLAMLLTASPASAHGIGGEASDRSILGFVPLGIEHMLLGWDHLLFIGGVVLLTRNWRRAVKMISIFVVGHSTTLIIATLAGWQVDAGAVDVVIALSVVFVGAVGAFVTKVDWNVFGVLVLIFGLIHGLGLSTRLQDLGLPEDGMLWRVIAFNVGVEIGQLTAILAMVAVAAVVMMWVGDGREAALRKVAAAGLFVVGTSATAMVAFQAFNDTDTDEVEVAVDETQDCSVGERTMQFPPMGGHTQKAFYGPEEETPMGDFGHSMGDGYVVVLYPPDLDKAQLQELRGYVDSPEGEGVLAGPDPESGDNILAITAYDTMTCGSLDMDMLKTFKSKWFESIQG